MEPRINPIGYLNFVNRSGNRSHAITVGGEITTDSYSGYSAFNGHVGGNLMMVMSQGSKLKMGSEAYIGGDVIFRKNHGYRAVNVGMGVDSGFRFVGGQNTQVFARPKFMMEIGEASMLPVHVNIGLDLGFGGGVGVGAFVGASIPIDCW